ncbi:tyrosine-type recombinase/integrase [Vibrio sp. 10N.261.55.A7]|uniref:tyrosine-type recombinase/integrase n=1 Tax=Vibrio sp. 10N.261.55.A7 TaxID=1880851 RepID=UPI000C854A53|nr:tyrosine-type recombinase/integrase [Vibrio sp. 10N.261.55.A7]PMJ90600.1 integrase [Vibrio sp. 10N.261.55.A7]
MRKKIERITDKEALNQWRTVFSSDISIEQFELLTQFQYSRNSMLAMVKDWNVFNHFCLQKHVRSLPASVTAVRRFIEHESEKRKFSTLKRYSVTISLVHRLLADSDPVANSQIRLLLAKYRLDKHGDAKQAAVFTAEHLQSLDTILMQSPTPKAVRDLSICYLMFECALKRSELKRLMLTNTHLYDDFVALDISDHTYRLSGRASYVLKQWLATLGEIDEGVLFSAIDKHGNISQRKMDDSSIYRVLKGASEILELPVNFSGHSTRVGAAKHLANNGSNIKEIQKFGRWLSPAMPYQYIGLKQKAEDEQQTFITIRPWE